MSTLIALKFLGPIGNKVLGTAVLGGVAAIGAGVADRTGLTERLSGAFTTLVGIPDGAFTKKPAQPPAAPVGAALPAAPVGAAEHVGPTPRTYCPICAAGTALSGIGEILEVKVHPECGERTEKSAADLPSVYIGWADSLGISTTDPRAPMPTIGDAGMRTAAGVPDLARLATNLRDWQKYADGLRIAGTEIGLSTTAECGEYPTINSPGMRDPQFGTPNYGLLSTAQSKWNECSKRVASANKAIDAANAKAQKAVDAVNAAKTAAATKAQKMAAAFSLARVEKKYNDQIAAMQAQQAQQADAAAKAQIQAQIDAITAQRDQATALADQLKASQASQQSAAQQAQIDALTREIADKGRTPGGMDEYMKMLLMQRLMAQPPSPPVAPWADPSQFVAAPVVAPAPVAAPQVIVVDSGAGTEFDEGYSLMGADGDTVLDPELAAELGIEGAETMGDANLLLDYRDEYGDDGDLDLSGCSIGSCPAFAVPAVDNS